jgi:hypothetical protein
MPRVRLQLNIGTKDSQRLGLDANKARAGETIDVRQAVADELIRNLWAVDARDEAAGPATVTAVPAAPSLKTPGQPDFQAMTKEQLKQYADRNKIEGVTMAHSKDEMIEAIEDGLTK